MLWPWPATDRAVFVVCWLPSAYYRMVRCQDGALGVIESVFAALDEVYVQRHGSTEPVKLNTKQITFLGEWSDSAARQQVNS